MLAQITNKKQLCQNGCPTINAIIIMSPKIPKIYDQKDAMILNNAMVLNSFQFTLIFLKHAK
jgi:hypothetical protein